jgi:hypothetical protein
MDAEGGMGCGRHWGETTPGHLPVWKGAVVGVALIWRTKCAGKAPRTEGPGSESLGSKEVATGRAPVPG